jgi:F420-dependent oxidoreductase-like protein
MTPAGRVSFGIKTAQQHTTYEEILQIWQAADQEPLIEHAWVFDHFIPQDPPFDGPCLEGWTLLAALAAQTRRLRIGVLVTGNTYRHPAVLAKMAATVDQISGGRLDFGLGAAWNEAEHVMYRIPLPEPKERIARLAEACEVIRQLWTEPLANFSGKYYQLNDARCEPKPLQQPRPPFVIGGGGEQLTLKVVARYADIWNIIPHSVEEFVRKSAILDGYCVAIGRDPVMILRSVQVISYDKSLDHLANEVGNYIAAGVQHIILEINPRSSPDAIQTIARQVVVPFLTPSASQ